MRYIASFVLCVLVQLAGLDQATAYTGGPLLVDILGWDAKSGRVYFHTIPADEGLSFGAVYYFDLGGAQKTRRVRVGWSTGEADANDPDRNRRLQSLRSRLTPLLPRSESCLGWGTTVLSADSVESTTLGNRARYRLSFTSDNGPRFEFTGYERPDACVKDVYEIPQRRERLYVLAYRGNPLDIAETQVAVLVSEPSDRTIQVTWEREK